MPGQVREKAPLQDKVVQCTHSSCIILSSLYKIQGGSYNHSHLTNEKLGIREGNDLPRLTQLERGRGSIQTEDFRLQSSYSFLFNQAASRVKLPHPPSQVPRDSTISSSSSITVYQGPTACMALLLFPQQHTARESWEYPVLKKMML